MDQALMDYLLEIGAMQPQQEQLAQKRALVNQLRQGGRTPGMRASPGMVHAANPLEFLGALAHQGVGQFKEGQADQMQDQYGRERRAALRSLRTKMMPSGNPSTQNPDDATAPY